MFSVAGNFDDIDNTVNQVEEVDEFEQKLDFELESIKRTMIEGLGFRRVPDVTKVIYSFFRILIFVIQICLFSPSCIIFYKKI